MDDDLSFLDDEELKFPPKHVADQKSHNPQSSPPSSSSSSPSAVPDPSVGAASECAVILRTQNGQQIQLIKRLLLPSVNSKLTQAYYDLCIPPERVNLVLHFLFTGILTGSAIQQMLLAYDLYRFFEIVPYTHIQPKWPEQDNIDVICWLLNQCPMLRCETPLNQWLLFMQNHPAVLLHCWQLSSMTSEIPVMSDVHLGKNGSLPRVRTSDLHQNIMKLVSTTTFPTASISMLVQSDESHKVSVFQSMCTDKKFNLFLWVMYKSGLFYPKTNAECTQFLDFTEGFHLFTSRQSQQKQHPSKVIPVQIETQDEQSRQRGKPQKSVSLPCETSLAWFTVVFEDLCKRFTYLEQVQLRCTKLLSTQTGRRWMTLLLDHEAGAMCIERTSSAFQSEPRKTAIHVACYMVPEIALGKPLPERESDRSPNSRAAPSKDMSRDQDRSKQARRGLSLRERFGFIFTSKEEKAMEDEDDKVHDRDPGYVIRMGQSEDGDQEQEEDEQDEEDAEKSISMDRKQTKIKEYEYSMGSIQSEMSDSGILDNLEQTLESQRRLHGCSSLQVLLLGWPRLWTGCK